MHIYIYVYIYIYIYTHRYMYVCIYLYFIQQTNPLTIFNPITQTITLTPRFCQFPRDTLPPNIQTNIKLKLQVSGSTNVHSKLGAILCSIHEESEFSTVANMWWGAERFQWKLSRCICKHKKQHCNTLQRTATHCNALQHTATHCNTLQHAHRNKTSAISSV